MADTNIGISLILNSKGYVQAINEAKKATKLIDTEFKNAVSSLDDWRKSSVGLESAIKKQKDTINVNKALIKKLSEELDTLKKSGYATQEGINRVTSAIKKSETHINNATKMIVKYNQEINDLKLDEILNKSKKGIDEANKKFEESVSTLDDWRKSSVGLESAIKKQSDTVDIHKTRIEELKAELERLNNTQGATEENKRKVTDAIRESNLAINNATKTINQYKKQLEEVKIQEEEAGTEVGKLTKRIEEQENQVKHMRLAYQNAVSVYGANSKQAKELAFQLNRTSSELRANKNEMKELEKQANRLDKSIEKQHKGFTILRGALASLVADGFRMLIQGVKDSVQAGIDYESAFTDVKKTVNATQSELKILNAEIRNMAKVLPQSAVAIAEVASNAGQLGIKAKDIASFTKTMIMLGDTTNLSSDEASTALARFANVVGMSSDNYDRLGSTIVALGNNFATTESEIVSMAERLAGVGKQVGMSEADIMAISTALTSVGIEAESGGTSFSTLLSKMQVAVESGSSILTDFAYIAGMTADEFKIKFKNDATGALQAFINGLADTERTGKSAIKLLVGMGLTETRLRDAILRTAGASNTFNDAIKVGRQGWSENNALAKEAEQRYDTTASKIQLMKNAYADLAISIFESIRPAFDSVLSGLTAIAKNADVVLVAIASMVAGIIALNWTGIVSAVGAVATAFKGLAVAMMANPVGLVIAGVSALVGAFVILWKKCEDFRDFWIVLWETIKFNFNNFIDWFISIWDTFKGIFNWDSISQKASDAWAVISDGASNAWNKITEVWSGVTGWFAERWNGITEGSSSLWSTIKEKSSGAWSTIKLKFQNIRSWFQPKWRGVKTDSKGLWDNISSKAGTAWEDVKTAFGGIREWFEDRFSGAWGSVKGVFNDWPSFFDGLWGKIVNTFNTLGESISEAIGDSVKSGLNGVISFIESTINKAIGLINGAIGIINKIPAVNIPTIETLNLPRLAKGGVVNTPTIAEIGENGAEAVVPLEKNTEWINKLADKISEKINTDDTGKYADVTRNWVITSQLTKLNSELDSVHEKILENGISQEEWADSIDSINERAEFLSTEYDILKEKLQALNKQYEIAVDSSALGAEGRNAKDIAEKIEAIKLELQGVVTEAGEVETAFNKMSEGLDNAGSKTTKNGIVKWLNDISEKEKEWANGTGKYISQVEGYFSKLSGGIMNTVNAWTGYSNQLISNRLAEISDELKMLEETSEAKAKQADEDKQAETDKLNKMYDAMKISAEEYYDGIEKIESNYQTTKAKNEKEADEKTKALKAEANAKEKAQFEAQKRNSIAQALIDGATAIVKGFAQLGPIGGAINAVIQAGITTAQIATISAQKFEPPYKLAKGGVVDKPTYSLIGEAGKEAVMPLENNTGWIRELAQQLAGFMASDTVVRLKNVSDGDSYNSVSNDNRVTNNYTQVINAPKTPSRRELYRDTKNLLALKGI